MLEYQLQNLRIETVPQGNFFHHIQDMVNALLATEHGPK